MVETPNAADLAEGPTHRFGGALSLWFLGLELNSDGEEVYEVSFRATVGAAWCDGRLRHLGGSSWALVDSEQATVETLALGVPDAVFALALGQPLRDADSVALAAPYWPVALHERLARRRSSGAATIAFDGRWFIARLTGSAIDRPLLLPGAVDKLGLGDLGRASQVVAAAAAEGDDPTDLIALLQRALGAGPATSKGPSWSGEGRLIGESTWNALVQLGADIDQGCQAALGTGPLTVAFEPEAPMGLGFGPEVPSDDVAAGRPTDDGASVGTGAEVGVVEPGGAAEAAGVKAGMVVTELRPNHGLQFDGDATPSFEDILDAIDACRDGAGRLAMTFDTAAPLTHWYAVEMPAASTLSALDAGRSATPTAGLDDAGVGASFDALCGAALLWREPIPRLFLGAPGSVTCAHVDICPQVQVAHGLLGTKVLGVASHEASPRLVAEHGTDGGGDIDEGATHVPTDRPLSDRQTRLLCDADISLVLLQAGDLAVLHSGALHFASNGAEGLGASLYHGLITPAAVPRLRSAARAAGGSGDGEGAYAEHLFAADLLQLVEARIG